MKLKGTLKTLAELTNEFTHTMTFDGELVFFLKGNVDYQFKVTPSLYPLLGKTATIPNATEAHRQLFKECEVVDESDITYQVKLKPLHTVLMSCDYKIDDKSITFIFPDGEHEFPLSFLKNLGEKIEVRKNKRDELVWPENNAKISSYLLEHVVSSTRDSTLHFVERLLSAL